jgi:hypothetical protein
LNRDKGGLDRDNVKECSQLRPMEKHVWNKVRAREETIKINEIKMKK